MSKPDDDEGGWVTLYVVVEGEPTDDEDQDVPGTYEVRVDAQLLPGDQMSAALDVFHAHVAVGTLDDFEITVTTEGGVVLEEGDSQAYPVTRRGEFLGKLDEDDA